MWKPTSMWSGLHKAKTVNSFLGGSKDVSIGFDLAVEIWMDDFWKEFLVSMLRRRDMQTKLDPSTQVYVKV